MQQPPQRFIDIHSHLLPVQDGPKDIGQAIQALRIAEKCNITDLILTPHYFSEDRTYDQRHILETFEILKAEIERNGLKIRIYLGNECVVDEKLVDDLQSGKAFTLNNSKYVLCEYPLYQVIYNYQNIIYALMDKGFKPIIAHPERNAFIDNYYYTLKELSQNGCKIQINAGSILGVYGNLSKHNAFKMIKHDLVDLIASDAHSFWRRSPNLLKKAYTRSAYIRKILLNTVYKDVIDYKPFYTEMT